MQGRQAGRQADRQAVPPTMTKRFLLWSVHTNLSALTKRSFFTKHGKKDGKGGGDATRKEGMAERVGQRTAASQNHEAKLLQEPGF